MYSKPIVLKSANKNSEISSNYSLCPYKFTGLIHSVLTTFLTGLCTCVGWAEVSALLNLDSDTFVLVSSHIEYCSHLQLLMVRDLWVKRDTDLTVFLDIIRSHFLHQGLWQSNTKSSCELVKCIVV